MDISPQAAQTASPGSDEAAPAGEIVAETLIAENLIAQPLIAQALAGMRPGWSALHDCLLPAMHGLPASRIALVLLHPALGVAVVDIGARPTPDGAGRVRRELDWAGFEARFPGCLPIVQHTVPAGQLALLESLLDRAFQSERKLDLPGGDDWVLAARQALTFAVPFRPQYVLPRHADREARAHPSRIGLTGLLWFWTAVAAVGGVGAVVLQSLGPLPDRPSPPPEPLAAASPAPPLPNYSPVAPPPLPIPPAATLPAATATALGEPAALPVADAPSESRNPPGPVPPPITAEPEPTPQVADRTPEATVATPPEATVATLPLAPTVSPSAEPVVTPPTEPVVTSPTGETPAPSVAPDPAMPEPAQSTATAAVAPVRTLPTETPAPETLPLAAPAPRAAPALPPSSSDAAPPAFVQPAPAASILSAPVLSAPILSTPILSAPGRKRARSDQNATASREPPAFAAASGTKPIDQTCRNILGRAQLGEDLSNEDRAILRSGCRGRR